MYNAAQVGTKENKIVGPIPTRMGYYDSSMNGGINEPAQNNMWIGTWAYRSRPIQYSGPCLGLVDFTWARPGLAGHDTTQPITNPMKRCNCVLQYERLTTSQQTWHVNFRCRNFPSKGIWDFYVALQR